MKIFYPRPNTLLMIQGWMVTMIANEQDIKNNTSICLLILCPLCLCQTSESVQLTARRENRRIQRCGTGCNFYTAEGGRIPAGKIE